MRKTEQACCTTCGRDEFPRCDMCGKNDCLYCEMCAAPSGTVCHRCWAIGAPFRAEMHRLDVLREEQEEKWRVACEKPKEGAK